MVSRSILEIQFMTEWYVWYGDQSKYYLQIQLMLMSGETWSEGPSLSWRVIPSHCRKMLGYQTGGQYQNWRTISGYKTGGKCSQTKLQNTFLFPHFFQYQVIKKRFRKITKYFSQIRRGFLALVWLLLIIYLDSLSHRKKDPVVFTMLNI